MIILAKCGQAKNTANLARNIASTIISKGGNVRQVKVLSDRVLPRPKLANDQKKYLVARFLQILFDGNLYCRQQTMKKAIVSQQIIKIDTFRVKDFYNQTQQYSKKVDESLLKDPEKFKQQTLNKIMMAKHRQGL